MNLLITGAWQDAAIHIPKLRDMGHAVEFLQYEKDALSCEYAWVEGVVCNSLFAHHPIERFENLTYIQLTSAGFDRVPMDHVKARGIEIHNARGVYSIPMAEFALASVLRIYKNMDFFFENQKSGIWEKSRSICELFGKNICIVGCGSIGTECAKRFAAFGCNVFGIDPFVKENEIYSEVFTTEKIKETFAKADIVVLTLPLTEETYHLIGKEELSAMREGAILINLARGAIVDSKALVNELEKGRIIAVLDVFEEEPLSKESPFWKLKNVLITPHNSFAGENNLERLWNVIKTNLEHEKIITE